MITASIVTYNTSIEDLNKLIGSLYLIKAPIKIIIIDNSPLDTIRSFFEKLDDYDYVHNPINPGFGASHNIAIQRSFEYGSRFHFVINPDIYFDHDVMSPMIEYMKLHPDVGMMMPQILNDDGTIQNLPKLLPHPFSIFLRKLKRPKYLYKTFINRYELRFINKDLIYNSPIISGCFTLFRVSALQKVGLYDDQFFMYFEDWDLSRRMHMKFKTVYFPLVSVYHGYESGANKSSRLFKIFVKSYIRYFNKWGWFFDKKRSKVNKHALEQFNDLE